MTHPLLPADYRPSENEPFMNPVMREYFRQKLLRWRSELLQESSETLISLQNETVPEADLTDRAATETDRFTELRTRDRERKLIKKVQQALARIDSGDYGYCEETGDPIGLQRLLARPTATLTVEAQQRRELRQRQFGD